MIDGAEAILADLRQSWESLSAAERQAAKNAAIDLAVLRARLFQKSDIGVGEHLVATRTRLVALPAKIRRPVMASFLELVGSEEVACLRDLAT